MKSNIADFIATHGGIWQSIITLYRGVFTSDFIRKVMETFATKVLLICIGLVTTVIVTRVLGPEGRGLYAVAIAIGAIGIQFGNLGLHASNIYFVSRDPGLLPILVSNALFVSFVLGGLCVALALVVFTLWPNLAPIHGLLLVLALLWIPFGLAYMMLQSLLLGIQQVRAYNKIETMNQFLGVILIGIVFVSGYVTVETLFFVALIALAISFGWALLHLRSHLTRLLTPSLSLFKYNVSYGIKVYLTDFAAFLVFRVDLLMVKYILGAKDAGFYSIAVTMADLVYVVPIVIGTILFPKLSAMKNGQWQYTYKVTIMVGLIMLIVVITAIISAKPAIIFLFGKEFLLAIRPFVWLMPGIYFISIQSILVKYLAVKNYPVIIIYTWTISLILNILLNLYFIRTYGIVGASIASTITYILITIIIIVSAFRFKRREVYKLI